MKGLKFIYLLSLVLLTLNLKAQIDTITVHANLQNKSLLEFLVELENKYPVNFYYEKEWLKGERLNGAFTVEPLVDVLNEIFYEKPYIYKILGDNMIVLLPREDIATLTSVNFHDRGSKSSDINTILIGNPNEAGKHREVVLSGTVLNGKNNEPLIGATIQIKDGATGTVTNLQGNYKFKMPPGYYTLLFSSIGFETTEQRIRIIGNGELDISLFEESINIDEVSIYAKRADRNVNLNQMSLIEMDAKTIKELPAITGEKDVLKGLTLMPGVKAVGEFGSGIHVRGGGDDQNLFLLNGAPLFNTSHVFGLISVINPDAVSELTLYKGHIPASYGERASSVIKIKLDESNPEKFKSSGGIGLYNTRLMFEVPALKNKLTIRLGGRASYSDWLLKRMNNIFLKNSSAFFYDFNGLFKLNLKKNHFSGLFYNSFDKFTFSSDFSYQYENRLASLKWTRIYKNGLVSSLTGAYSDYSVNKDEIDNVFYKTRVNTGISYKSIKANFSYNNFARHKFDWGGKIINYHVNPGKRIPLSNQSLVTSLELEKEQGLESVVYFSDVFDVTTNLSLNVGLRYSFYSYLGPVKVFKYEGNFPMEANITETVNYEKNDFVKTYGGLEPRISLNYQLEENNSIKLSYNRNLQYLTLISHTSISTPDDIWKLSDNYLEPVKVNQFATGYYHNFSENKLETSIEVYYKDITNVREYRNNANIACNDHIETELIDANARSYGIELFTRKNGGKIEGWISYTFSRTFTRTNGSTSLTSINNNQKYPSTIDKPHDLKIVANYNVNKRIRVSANFSLMSGRPVTLPEYHYKYDNNWLVYYSDRNEYRLPPYHRLDIAFSVDESLEKKKKWKGSWTFSILNVYGRNNAYSVFYRKEVPGAANDNNWFNMYKLYIIGRPLPTLTYSFKF